MMSSIQAFSSNIMHAFLISPAAPHILYSISSPIYYMVTKVKLPL
jgi:hypothetical protein